MGRKILFALFFVYSLSVFGNQQNQIDSLFSQIRKMYSVDLDSAYNLASTALALGKNSNDTRTIVLSNFYLGYISDSERKKPLVGLIHYLDAVKQFEMLPEKSAEAHFMNICENVGTIYNHFGQSDIARNFYSKAHKIAITNDDFPKQTRLLRLIAGSCSKPEDDDLFYLYADSAINCARRTSIDQLFGVLNYIGVKSLEKGDYEKALDFFKEITTSEHASNQENFKDVIYATHNIGNCYVKLNNLPLAKSYLSKATLLKEQNIDRFSAYNFFNSYFDLGEVFYLSSDFDSANYYFDKALSYTGSFNISEFKNRFRIHQLYSISLAKTGDTESALQHQLLYDDYMDNYLLMKERVAIENQKLNIDLITKRFFDESNSADEMQSSFQWIAFASGLIILALIGIISAMAYRSNQLKRNIESELKSIMSSTPDTN